MRVHKPVTGDRSSEWLHREVDRILVQASVVTDLFMGLISLLFYEVIDARPEPNVAAFSFGMAFIFTVAIGLFNTYVNNRRGLPTLYQFIDQDY